MESTALTGPVQWSTYLLSLEVVHETVVLHAGPALLPALAQLRRLEAENVSAADGRVT